MNPPLRIGDRVRIINSKSAFNQAEGKVIDTRNDRTTTKMRVQVRFTQEMIQGRMMTPEPWFAFWEVENVNEDGGVGGMVA